MKTLLAWPEYTPTCCTDLSVGLVAGGAAAAAGAATGPLEAAAPGAAAGAAPAASGSGGGAAPRPGRGELGGSRACCGEGCGACDEAVAAAGVDDARVS